MVNSMLPTLTGGSSTARPFAHRPFAASVAQRRGGRSVHAALLLGPEGLAQIPLEDLPGARLRERLVTDVDRARDLEPGDALLAVGDDLGGGQRGRLGDDDHRVHPLAPPLV